MKAQDLLALVHESSKGSKSVEGELSMPSYDNLNTPDNHVDGKGSREIKNAKKDFGKKRDMRNRADPGKPKKGEKRGMEGPGATYGRMNEDADLSTVKQRIYNQIEDLDVDQGTITVIGRGGRKETMRMDPALLHRNLMAIRKATNPQTVSTMWQQILRAGEENRGRGGTVRRGGGGRSVGKPMTGPEIAAAGQDWTLADSEGSKASHHKMTAKRNIVGESRVPQEWWTALNWMDRSQLEDILAGVGIASYPKESDDELKQAIISNIQDGTLDPSVLDEGVTESYARRRKNLSVPDKHQIRIARDTLKMSDAGARIMGGMTKDEAREILRKHGIKFSESYATSDSMSWDQPVQKGGPVSKSGKVRSKVDDEPANKGDPGKPTGDGKDRMGDGANLGKIMNPKKLAQVRESVRGLEKLLGRRLNLGRWSKAVGKQSSFNEGSTVKLQEAMDPVLYRYLRTALWSTPDENGEPLSKEHSVKDFAPEAIAQAQKDIRKFQHVAGHLLDGQDMTQVAYDFWLTRNYHGAGFGDGDYEDPPGLSDKLIKIAHQIGEIDPYVGDDGQVHFS